MFVCAHVYCTWYVVGLARALFSMLRALWASLGRPHEVLAMLRYKLLVSDRASRYLKPESVKTPSKGDSQSLAMCYHLLNRTSRSFARVIQEVRL